MVFTIAKCVNATLRTPDLFPLTLIEAPVFALKELHRSKVYGRWWRDPVMNQTISLAFYEPKQK